MRILAILLVAVTLVACETGVEPLPRPPGATPMEPLPVYDIWETELEACAGYDGDFDDIRWYMVPGDRWVDTQGRTVDGTYRTSGEIYIAEASTENRGTVVHEMLHHLLWTLKGERGHPSPPFGTCAPTHH